MIDAANAVAAEGLRRVSRDVAEAMAPRKVAALALAELRAQRHGPWTAAELREWLATLPWVAVCARAWRFRPGRARRPRSRGEGRPRGADHMTDALDETSRGAVVRVEALTAPNVQPLLWLGPRALVVPDVWLGHTLRALRPRNARGGRGGPGSRGARRGSLRWRVGPGGRRSWGTTAAAWLLAPGSGCGSTSRRSRHGSARRSCASPKRPGCRRFQKTTATPQKEHEGLQSVSSGGIHRG